MKICFVLNSHLSASMGGAEYQASLIMQELEKNTRNELFYLCRNAGEADKNVIKVKSSLRFAKFAYFLDSLKLYKQLKMTNPDVVYHRNAGAYTGVCAYYCKRYNKKFVWNLAHDKDVTNINWKDLKKPFKFIDKLLLSYGIHNKKTIIAQTKEQQALLQKNYNITDSILIPNFHPVPEVVKSKNKVKQILWVANLKAAKQPEFFLELAEKFRNNSSVKFIMVGNSSPVYEPLIAATQLNNDNFEFKGSIPQVEVNSLILNSDLFVNTSLSEGFPNTFIQAWLRGTPVMSVNVDPSNLIKNEKIGVVANNLRGMIITIEELILTPLKFEMMGQRAIDYATKNHSLKNIDGIKNLMGIID